MHPILNLTQQSTTAVPSGKAEAKGGDAAMLTLAAAEGEPSFESIFNGLPEGRLSGSSVPEPRPTPEPTPDTAIPTRAEADDVDGLDDVDGVEPADPLPGKTEGAENTAPGTVMSGASPQEMPDKLVPAEVLPRGVIGEKVVRAEPSFGHSTLPTKNEIAALEPAAKPDVSARHTAVMHDAAHAAREVALPASPMPAKTEVRQESTVRATVVPQTAPVSSAKVIH